MYWRCDLIDPMSNTVQSDFFVRFDLPICFIRTYKRTVQTLATCELLRSIYQWNGSLSLSRCLSLSSIRDKIPWCKLFDVMRRKSTDGSYELHSLTRRLNINASNTQLNWTHSSRWLIALYIVWMAPRKILCLYLTWPMQKQYTTAGAQPRKSKATFWVFWFSFFPNFFPRYGI